MYSETPNTNYLKSIANNDDAFFEQLITIIQEEFPLERNEFQQNFDNKAYKLAAENIHKIKHKINIFGLETGYNIAVSFEKELKQKKSSKYTKFIEVLNCIEHYLKTL